MTEDIGYGKPPKATRWRKGQSGNPSGRPRGSPDLAKDLESELAEVIQITEGGKSKRITKMRALLKALAARAIKGDTRAANILITLSARLIEADPSLSNPAAPSAADRQIVEDYLEQQLQARLAKLKGPEQ
jgi:hypothetical protein